LTDPKLAKKLSTAGYQRVQNHLTWHAAARKTVDTYQRVINDYRKI
jgi:glycosyltransferase involved in cell wall biosynthesis